MQGADAFLGRILQVIKHGFIILNWNPKEKMEWKLDKSEISLLTLYQPTQFLLYYLFILDATLLC